MTQSDADDLLAFIDASPTPYHAVAEAAARLTAAGFDEVGLADAWPAGGSQFCQRGGALVAWSAPEGTPERALRIIGAHTDSPNLRIKPRPDMDSAGFRQLDVETYGGLLLNSWLDRDLGLAGRAVVRDGPGRVATKLFRDDRPLLRVPQLAIHLDRDISTTGLLLNRQQHMAPVWGLGESTDGEFASWLADAVGVPSGDILGWDAMCHDTLPAGFLGSTEELISAPRLDNQCSCFGAVRSLIDAAGLGDAVPMIALFDHEEVGSTSSTGADSALLGQVIERMIASRGGGPDDVVRALAASSCLSADMAHGTHPNYTDRHEPNHWITVGGGPVIKTNLNQRYATDGLSGAQFRVACERVGVPVQEYSHRNDLPCGSTIGPITAAQLGIPTVDVGMPQLSMHSIRELMASSDVALMVTAFTAWLTA